MNLNFHMKVEQWVHFATGSFFNFNGTAGVWRKKAIDDVGGWSARTVTEDMDLSLRAYLAGWKGVFLPDVTVLSELPAAYTAYRRQQHRWTCGAVHLWKFISKEIWTSKIPYSGKLELYFIILGLRKACYPFLPVVHLCLLCPLIVYNTKVELSFDDLKLPLDAHSLMVYVPSASSYSITDYELNRQRLDLRLDLDLVREWNCHC